MAKLLDVAGELTRSGRYLIAAEADAEERTVLDEWERWSRGEAASGSVRQRIRRVAEAMGAIPGGYRDRVEPAEVMRTIMSHAPPDPGEDGKATGPEAA